MKNRYLIAALSLGLVTAACEPYIEEGDFDMTVVEAGQMLSNATFEQESNSNTIKYSVPSVSSVTVFAKRPDGSENVLASGTNAGSFSYTPSRGSDPQQTIYFRYIDANGQAVVAEKQFTFVVAADLTADMKLLVSDEGTKVWTWNTEAPNGRIWGNMGYGDQSGAALALEGANQWWGVTCEDDPKVTDETGAETGGNGFLQQLNHSDTGAATGEESMEATMVISEEGTIKCYDKNGVEIRSGKFEVQNYDPEYAQNTAYCGILHTDEGTILFPFEINKEGSKPTDFQIAYLSPGCLTLLYSSNGGANSWAEATYWQFKSESDLIGCLTDNDKATWTWDTEDGTAACWGNMGYLPGTGASFANDRNGQWWGVQYESDPDYIEGDSNSPSNGFLQQLQHTPDGKAHGDESMSATMVFSADGTLTKYDGTGKEMQSGAYTITSNGGKRADHDGTPWELGTLTTAEGAILWPYAINTNGFQPTEYEVLKLTDTKMVLVYAAEGTGGWGEATFWRFKKVTE